MPAAFPVRSVVRGGLVGGVVVIYLAMVGMIEKFADRSIVGEQVTLARVLMAVPPFMAAYIALRPRVAAGQMAQAGPAGAALGGALSGMVTGGVTAAGVWLVDLLTVERIRPVFISISPTLMDTITFGQGAAVRSVILILGGALFGAMGGLFRTLQVRIRRPITIGAAATLLVALLQRVLQPMLFQLGLATDWLYSPITGGLTYLGAAVTFVVPSVGSAIWLDRGTAVRGRLEGTPQGRKATTAVLAVIAILLLAVLPQLVGSVISEILGTVGVFLLLGLGLNIVVGYAGLLDLGYVAFFAVGAYTMALLTGANLVTAFGLEAPTASAHLSFYASLPFVVLIAAFVGLLIGAPVLRLRGDYLAIVTLGFGEIARVLITSNWLKPVVGGAQGMRDVTSSPLLGFDFRDPQHFYYLVVVFCVLAAFVSWRLASSRIGRAWNAMREDEQVAEAMGISTVRYKLLAFAIGGGIGAVGGALFAVKIGSITPQSFKILVSITALALIILGGMGSVPGVILGALVLIGLPGLLSEFEEYRLLIYGAVLVAIMILRPQGLIPNVRRQRELQEEEVLQDAWGKGTPEAEPSTFSWEEAPS